MSDWLDEFQNWWSDTGSEIASDIGSTVGNIAFPSVSNFLGGESLYENAINLWDTTQEFSKTSGMAEDRPTPYAMVQAAKGYTPPVPEANGILWDNGTPSGITYTSAQPTQAPIWDEGPPANLTPVNTNPTYDISGDVNIRDIGYRVDENGRVVSTGPALEVHTNSKGQPEFRIAPPKYNTDWINPQNLPTYSTGELYHGAQPEMNANSVVSGATRGEKALDWLNTPAQGLIGAAMYEFGHPMMANVTPVEGESPAWAAARLGAQQNVTGVNLLEALVGSDAPKFDFNNPNQTTQAMGVQAGGLLVGALADPLTYATLGEGGILGKAGEAALSLTGDLADATLGKWPGFVKFAHNFSQDAFASADLRKLNAMKSISGGRLSELEKAQYLWDADMQAKVQQAAKDAGMSLEDFQREVGIGMEAKPKLAVIPDIPRLPINTADAFKKTELIDSAIEGNTDAVSQLHAITNNPKVLEATTPDELRHAVFDPNGLLDANSDVPRIPVTNTPIVRWSNDVISPEDNWRGMKFYSYVNNPGNAEEVGAARIFDFSGENTLYRGSDIGSEEGGVQKTVGYLKPQKPLVVNIDSVSSGIGPDLFNKFYPDVFEGIPSSEKGNVLKGMIDDLKLPKEEADWLKKSPLQMADRLVAEKAKAMGYDAIIGQDEYGQAEIAVLRNTADPKPIGDINLFRMGPAEQKAVLDKMPSLVRPVLENAILRNGGKVNQQVMDTVMELRKIREENRAFAASKGIVTGDLQDELVDYMTRAIDPSAKKQLVDLGIQRGWWGSKREFNPVTLSQKVRVEAFAGLNHDEINALGRAGELGQLIPGLEGIKFKKFLIDDPVALETIRNLRDIRAVNNLRFLQDSATEFGVTSKKPIDGMMRLSLVTSQDPRMKAIAPLFKDQYFTQEIAANLNKMVNVAMTDGTQYSMAGVFDWFNRFWKPLALNTRPSTITRNAIGNYSNNLYIGLANPRWYEDVAKATGTIEGKAGRMSVDQFNKVAADFGIDAGMVSVESRAGYAGGGKLTAMDVPVLGKYLRKAYEANSAVEANARRAHFAYQMLEKGMSPFEAAMSVKKYLFDYATGLTDFERGVLRPVMPFYAWTRFNLPLQAEMLLTKPRPIVRLAEVVNQFKDTPASQKMQRYSSVLADYIQANTGIPVKTDAHGNPMVFLLGGWLPVGDLFSLASKDGAINKAAGLLTPVITEPIQQAWNYDPFRDSKITEFDGQTRKMFGVDTPTWIAHVLRVLPPIADLDRLYGTGTPDQQKAYSQAVRWLTGITTYKIDTYGMEEKKARLVEDTYNDYIKALMTPGQERNAKALEKRLNELYAEK